MKERATRVQRVTLDDGREGWEYSDGAIRDDGGRAMTLPPKMQEHAITSDNAHEMIRLREQKRMRLYAEGAQMAVADVSLLMKYGQDAHIVERARTLQEIASTRDAGKAAVMADQSLRKAQGLEPTAAELQGTSGGNTVNLLVMIAELARRGEVVDAE